MLNVKRKPLIPSWSRILAIIINNNFSHCSRRPSDCNFNISSLAVFNWGQLLNWSVSSKETPFDLHLLVRIRLSGWWPASFSIQDCLLTDWGWLLPPISICWNRTGDELEMIGDVLRTLIDNGVRSVENHQRKCVVDWQKYIYVFFPITNLNVTAFLSLGQSMRVPVGQALSKYVNSAVFITQSTKILVGVFESFITFFFARKVGTIDDSFFSFEATEKHAKQNWHWMWLLYAS